MKYFYTFTIIFILTINLILAQSSLYIQSRSGLTEVFLRSTPPKDNFSDIRGSPYLSANWEYGTVTLNNNKKFQGLFRYNIYSQEIELLYKNNFLSINAPHKIREIRIGPRKFIYALIIEKKKGYKFLFTGYLEILAEGKVNLLLHRGINIKEDTSPSDILAVWIPGKIML